MLCNSSHNTGLMSLDILQNLEDPIFSKRVEKSSGNMCVLCLDEVSQATDQYQVRCPTNHCRYVLCHVCMKRVFTFKRIECYYCFICHAMYQQCHVDAMLNERLNFLDDESLRNSFVKLIVNLPAQFSPETIREKERQQQDLRLLKNLSDTFGICIMNPGMTEEDANCLQQRLVNSAPPTEVSINESAPVEEVGRSLSTTCAPAVPPITTIKEEHEREATTNRLWHVICNICSSIWNNIQRFVRHVKDLIVSLCTSLSQYLHYCPASLRPTIQQQLDKIRQSLKRSHCD